MSSGPSEPESPGTDGMRQLLAVVARLRAPDGCPWDREQTWASMAPHLLEEAYEAVDALRAGDAKGAREELGDVLVNVLLLAQISADQGGFEAQALAASSATKLVRRHPHVFGEHKVDGAEAAYRNWERMKQQERQQEPKPKGVLDGVPAALPALLRACRIGEKAARVGFDWPDAKGPRAKVDEELAELDAAVASGSAAQVEAELGDLLFSVCNLARHLGANPEMALRGTIERFTTRFRHVEQALGPDLKARSLEELEQAWQEAKEAGG